MVIILWYDARLKAGIVEPDRKSVASQRLSKHKFPLQQKTWNRPLLDNS
jgi:hypothetical protein